MRQSQEECGMTIEEMKERKKELGYSMAKLSEYSGVPLGTLQKIFSGETKAPRYETIQALEKALRYNPYDDVLREPSTYNVKKKYTIEDYFALPDEPRMELIDGEFFEMTAPIVKHQAVLRELFRQVDRYIQDNHGSCEAYFAPLDVQLDCDEYTMVQPDLIVVCDESIITEERVVGAPDFIVEVLSPSTREKDAVIKMKKYKEAGVREYWMVDIKKEKVIVYFFEEDIIPVIYGFEQEVPVGIYDGKLKIRFA